MDVSPACSPAGFPHGLLALLPPCMSLRLSPLCYLTNRHTLKITPPQPVAGRSEAWVLSSESQLGGHKLGDMWLCPRSAGPGLWPRWWPGWGGGAVLLLGRLALPQVWWNSALCMGRSWFSCWLSAGGHSQLPEATHILCLGVPSSSNLGVETLPHPIPLHVSNLSFQERP